ncbi:hypothetical protein [uncultured Agitococcus sp.]|mgnify:FL=1|uniref:hypothetical protein n=1 Tax=uncultured Agitococcus sp. TaxID=1506599 RepID=UPI002612E68A|nr:hypothetical protein [uncultured Agitococcus sp.]
MLSPNQIRANARKFSLEWKDETRERAESQMHLLDIETQQQQKILVANLADNIELFGFISGYETYYSLTRAFN